MKSIKTVLSAIFVYILSFYTLFLEIHPFAALYNACKSMHNIVFSIFTFM